MLRSLVSYNARSLAQSNISINSDLMYPKTGFFEF